MLKPGALPLILEMVEVQPLSCIGAFHTCPLHTSETDVLLDGKPRTMRIFPTLDGDFVFRCAHCGFVGTTLEFLAGKFNKAVNLIAGRLQEDGLLERPYTATEVSNASLRMDVDRLFGLSGLIAYQKTVESRKRPAVFGDFGVVGERLCAKFCLPSPNHNICRRVRNIFGLTTSLRFSYDGVSEAWIFPLGPQEPIEVSMSPSCDYYDLEEVIVCSNPITAEGLDTIASQWPKADRLPILMLERFDCEPIASALPFKKVWWVRTRENSETAGLCLHDPPRTTVKVVHLNWDRSYWHDMNAAVHTRSGLLPTDAPDAFDDLCESITDGSRGTVTARLGKILSVEHLGPRIKRDIVKVCALRSGKTVATLLAAADAASSPYAVRQGQKMFVQRNGIYLVKDRHDQWQRVSNFSLGIISTAVTQKGDAKHELLLTVEGRCTTFTVTAAVLDDHPRLWRATRRAAALGELPELLMPNGRHRALLPTLVKMTKGINERYDSSAEKGERPSYDTATEPCEAGV